MQGRVGAENQGRVGVGRRRLHDLKVEGELRGGSHEEVVDGPADAPIMRR